MIAVSGPDFVVASMQLFPPSPRQGDAFTAQVVINNTGNKPGDAGSLLVMTFHPFDLETAPCGAGPEYGGASVQLGTLAAGASVAVNVTGLTSQFLSAQRMLAFVDSACATTEVRTNRRMQLSQSLAACLPRS